MYVGLHKKLIQIQSLFEWDPINIIKLKEKIVVFDSVF